MWPQFYTFRSTQPVFTKLLLDYKFRSFNQHQVYYTKTLNARKSVHFLWDLTKPLRFALHWVFLYYTPDAGRKTETCSVRIIRWVQVVSEGTYIVALFYSVCTTGRFILYLKTDHSCNMSHIPLYAKFTFLYKPPQLCSEANIYHVNTHNASGIPPGWISPVACSIRLTSVKIQILRNVPTKDDYDLQTYVPL
jgi:hypothetical protein